MNRAPRMTGKELAAQALSDALAAELADEERPVPAPRLPRGAKDLPICSECCIELGFLCCPVHGIRDLPAWLVQWLRDLQNPQAQQTAAIGYWSQSMETIISCPECERKLVAPSERTETVRCPKCLATWKLTAGEAAEPLREKDTLADRFERSGLLYPDVDFVPSPFIGCPDCELEPDLAIGFPDKEDWTERRLRVMRCRIHGTRWVDYVHWAGEKGVLWSELRTSDTLADRRLKEVNETVTERRLSSSEPPAKRPTPEEQYQAYLEFGADFNWD